jgi:hypothetical protein
MAISSLTLGDLESLARATTGKISIGEWKKLMREFRDKMGLDDRSAVVVGHFVREKKVQAFLAEMRRFDDQG